jgi:NAD+--asparagine ADP-ribosyltransferase
LEKLTNHVATLYGTDIGTELATNTRYHIPKPRYSYDKINQHEKAKVMRKEMATLIKDALENEVERIEKRINRAITSKTDAGSDPYLLVEKKNRMRMLQLEINTNQPMNPYI